MDPAALLIMLGCAVAVTAFARRKDLSAPLVVTGVALAVSFIPGVSRIEASSELILGVVLPPLLFSAALNSSYRDFRASLRSITRMGIGAVLVTALAVAAVAYWLLPDLPFSAALVLGAVVAPPDAVAASAVGMRLGLPRKVQTLLSGESLINDAAALTLFKVSLAAVAAIGSQSFWDSGPAVFGEALVIGVCVGLAIGMGVHWVRMRLSDPTVESVLGLLVPFAAYFIAEHILGSGVLAVVAAGLYLGYNSPHAGASTRLRDAPIWTSLDLLLEAFTFALIGLQLKWVIAEIVSAKDSTTLAFGTAAIVLAITILIRPIYIFATNWMDNTALPWDRSRARETVGAPNWRESVIVSWAGMRGVVTLAAATAIPAVVNGQPFPHHATIQLVAYVVAIGTLLIHGLTLPWLIRRLKLPQTDESEDRTQEIRVRQLAAEASAQVVDDRIAHWTEAMGKDKAEMLAHRIQEGLRRHAIVLEETLNEAAETELEVDVISPASPTEANATPATTSAPDDVTLPESATPEQNHKPARGAPPARGGVSDTRPPAHDHDTWRGASGRGGPGHDDMARRLKLGNKLRLDLIAAQREILVAERDEGRLNEIVMRRILRELDLEEESLSSSWLTRY